MCVHARHITHLITIIPASQLHFLANAELAVDSQYHVALLSELTGTRYTVPKHRSLLRRSTVACVPPSLFYAKMTEMEIQRDEEWMLVDGQKICNFLLKIIGYCLPREDVGHSSTRPNPEDRWICEIEGWVCTERKRRYEVLLRNISWSLINYNFSILVRVCPRIVLAQQIFVTIKYLLLLACLIL